MTLTGPARRLAATAAGVVLVAGCSTTSSPSPAARATATASPPAPVRLAEAWLDEADRLLEAGDPEGALACVEAALELLDGAPATPGGPGVEEAIGLAQWIEERTEAVAEPAGEEPVPLEGIEVSRTVETGESAPEASGPTPGSGRALAPRAGLPIEVNRHVRRFLEAFTRPGELRRRIERGFARGGAYLSLVRRQLREAGLPEELVWLPVIESGYSTTARSRAGARGMWQFMASTARRYGLRVDALVDERRDPVRSTEAAVAHLADLHAEFGDWYLALAAYNSGAGNVRRAIRRAHSRDFWRIRRHLPRETRDYVPAFLATVIIARDPTAYGLDPPEERRWAYDEIEVPDALDLQFLAQRLEVPVARLRELNPALRYGLTPARTRTRVRVPEGMGSRARKVLDSSPRTAWAPRLLHTVRRGESLSTIARRYGSSVAAIRRANRLRGSLIRPGQRLVVPRGAWSPRPPASPRRIDGAGRYTVRRGDTLWEIARSFGTSVEDLAAANGIPPRATLRPGQTLRIPTARPDARHAPAPRAAGALEYRVRRGDTLYGIARRFGVTVPDLKRVNGLRSATIHPGQRLLVPADRRQARAGLRSTRYRVRRGDTLYGIARRFGVSLRDLKRANGLRSNLIRPGQVLAIPGRQTSS